MSLFCYPYVWRYVVTSCSLAYILSLCLFITKNIKFNFLCSAVIQRLLIDWYSNTDIFSRITCSVTCWFSAEFFTLARELRVVFLFSEKTGDHFWLFYQLYQSYLWYFLHIFMVHFIVYRYKKTCFIMLIHTILVWSVC